MNYKKIKITLIFYLIYSTGYYIYDYYFSGRWEWPTLFMLPIVIIFYTIIIFPGLVIGYCKLNRLITYLLNHLLVFNTIFIVYLIMKIMSSFITQKNYSLLILIVSGWIISTGSGILFTYIETKLDSK